MKKPLLLVCLAVVTVLVVFCFWPRSTQKPAASAPPSVAPSAAPSATTAPTSATLAAESASAASPQPSNASRPTTLPGPPAPEIPSDLLISPTSPPPDLSPTSLLENTRTAIHSYASMFGGNPVGNNAEITRALLGENPRQAHFLKAEAGQRINANGELVDAWGTPYFFHALSGTEMEIRSAGPDKKMYTGDDVVIK